MCYTQKYYKTFPRELNNFPFFWTYKYFLFNFCTFKLVLKKSFNWSTKPGDTTQLSKELDLMLKKLTTRRTYNAPNTATVQKKKKIERIKQKSNKTIFQYYSGEEITWTSNSTKSTANFPAVLKERIEFSLTAFILRSGDCKIFIP